MSSLKKLLYLFVLIICISERREPPVIQPITIKLARRI